MRSFRLRLELLAYRYGLLPALSILLALAAAWFPLVGTPRLQEQAAVRRGALEVLKADARRIRTAGEEEQPLVRQRYAAFQAHLTRRDSIPDLVRTLFAEARQAGLVLQRVDYKLQEEPGEPYGIYSITVPVKGAYANIYRFAEGVLVKLPAAALEEVSFKRESAGSASTEARLRFAVYLRAEE